MSQGNNMLASCQACGGRKECNYIKYNMGGFELMYLVCVDCFTHVQMAGMREIRVVISQFRTATRVEAEKVATRMAQKAKVDEIRAKDEEFRKRQEKRVVKKKVSKKVSKKVPRTK